MILHWSPKSPFVRKVMMAAHELGLIERLTLVRTVAAMTRVNPALMANNPLGKIPVLVLDDGRRLFDSLVICEYLDEVAGGGRLVPAHGSARWQALTWHALGSGLLDLLILWRNEREKPTDRQTSDWLESFAAKVDASLDLLNDSTGALDAVPFGIGHIAIGCALGYADFRFAELNWRGGRFSLTDWAARFASRPSAVKTEVVDG